MSEICGIAVLSPNGYPIEVNNEVIAKLLCGISNVTLNNSVIRYEWPEKMVWDKMVRTKWYEQNGNNFYRFQFNLIEFLISNHKSQISDTPKWV